jgi:hypothetical protein
VRKISSFSSYLPKAAAVALAGGMALLSGCGLGTVATDVTPNAPVSGIEISGTAFGGATAISGAYVKLWASGVNGYGTGATLLGTSGLTAASTGTFTISPTFSQSLCTSPSTQALYVTLSGGDPTGSDGSGSTNNYAILLADVLGMCNNVTSSIHISINEATTVAAAYALGNFTTVGSQPGGLSGLNIGTSSTNTQGLQDAVANALAIVDPTSGTKTTGINTTALVPTAAVNSLANTMTSCVNASAYTSYPCGDQSNPAASGLFTLATPPGGTKPSNVYQAFMNIAKYPGQNVSSLLQLGSGYSLFQPTLATTTTNSTTAPNDLTLGIAYPNTTQAVAAGNSAVAMTIDGLDNIWVIGASSGTSSSTYNYLTELSSPSAGATYSNTLGSTQPLDGTHTLRNARFDTSGNMWITDKNSTAGGVIELPKSGSTVNVAGATEYTFGITALDQNDYDLAVDASGNVFTASYGAQGNCTVSTSATECYYVEFPAGSSYVATDTFGSSVQPTPTVRGMAADTVASSSGLGSIWTANYGVFGGGTGGGTSVEVLNPSTGALTTVTLGTAADAPFGIALDKTGGAYVDTGATAATSALYYVAQGTGAPGTTSTGANTPTVNTSVTSSVSVAGNSGTLGNIPNAASSLPANSATAPLTVGGLNGPGYLAVDGAGSVWLANYNYGSVVEYSPTLNGYVSPYYGFSPSVTVPAQPLTVTAVTLASAGTANIYYTGDTAINGQQVTFSGFPTGGKYAFLNGNTYTISSTSLNYFVIPDGGQASVGKTTTSGTATIAATSQVVFQCGPYVTTSTTTTCTTVGNAASRNNGIGIDRAGTVWTLGTNGTLVGLIGTAAPSDPVLADGKTGVLP